jgi:fucose permease
MKRKTQTSLLLIGLTYLGFVSIGLPDGLLGVAWPSMRGHFGLALDALGSLLVMYTGGYLISSFSSGRLLSRMSVGVLLALSCLATGISIVGYATAGSWWMVQSWGALAGFGAGAIDAGLNTYAATHFRPRIVNLLHAFYGIGALSGPLLMTAVLDRGQTWQSGYAIVGAGQLALAACFGLTNRQWNGEDRFNTRQSSVAAETVNFASSLSTMRLPVVWLSVAVFFIYTGIEAAAGAWAYSLFTEARGVPMVAAGTWVSVYWGSLTIGRIISAMIVGLVSTRLLLRCCIIGQALGAALIWSNLIDLGGFFGLALAGAASAPIFPSLIATTPDRISRDHVANAVGFQIAAAVLGQSLLPAVVGVLARGFGLEIIAPVLLATALLLFGMHEAMTRTGFKPLLCVPSTYSASRR